MKRTKIRSKIERTNESDRDTQSGKNRFTKRKKKEVETTEKRMKEKKRKQCNDIPWRLQNRFYTAVFSGVAHDRETDKWKSIHKFLLFCV